MSVCPELIGKSRTFVWVFSSSSPPPLFPVSSPFSPSILSSCGESAIDLRDRTGFTNTVMKCADKKAKSAEASRGEK